MRQCSYCEQFFSKIHRRYFGKPFCSSCYYYMFPSRICASCNKKKRIYRYSESSVCQQCIIQEMPCHRCRTINYTLGKLTEYGPVCNSCARYYLAVKYCCRCASGSKRLSRYLMFGELEPVCFKCLKAAHFQKCSNCNETKPPYFSKLDHSNLCKECTNSPFKQCVVCNTNIPSGAFGRKCQRCFSEATLLKRLKINKAGFSKQIAELYEQYTTWLSLRCGPAKASRQILLDRNVFEFLDNWYRENHSFPSYELYRRELTVIQNRQNILAQKFILERGLLLSDKARSPDIDEKNTIRRLIRNAYASHGTIAIYVLSYYRFLLNKYRKGLTSIRSVRLALTPAAKMIRMGEALHKQTLDQELLNQYLWFHLGQMNAITGFINYLRCHQKLDLKINSADYFVIPRTKESKRRLKLQMIDYLKQEGNLSIQFIKLGMAYFHGIKLPDELCNIELYNDCKYTRGMLTVCLAKDKYLLPVPEGVVPKYSRTSER